VTQGAFDDYFFYCENKDPCFSVHSSPVHNGWLDYAVFVSIFSEALRKYPPVPILNRECTKTYKIPGSDVTLEKGMLTVIPVLGLHYDPKYYPDPDRFDPERFSEEEKAKRHHFVYLPFGEGPRICIGK
jgi:cytochrome P450